MKDELLAGDGEPSSLFASLRSLTPARVGLGRTGVSQRLSSVLDFQRAHAEARDAVHAQLDAAGLAAAIENLACATQGGALMRLRSAASDRTVYLQRPDLGRMLDSASSGALNALGPGQCDVAIVVADGLSALAVERNAVAVIAELLPQWTELSLGPICVVEQGRVAIGDQIGELLRATVCVVLIGERPGLSSPDSLGAYITWEPRAGRTDAERNCISNIRTEGLSASDAAAQIAACVKLAFQYKLTGVALGEASRMFAAPRETSEAER